MTSTLDRRPLIVHLLYRFDVGGLENGVVNLINRLPAGEFRHAVVALTEVTAFRRRVERDDVQYVALQKSPGQTLKLAPRFARLLRDMRPTVVHSRNLAALELMLPAAWAGVPVRLHGEHGWNVDDPDGRSLKNRLVRRAFRPFVHHYVALSGQLQRYLVESVGVAAERIERICNGVDADVFRPAPGGRMPIAGSPFVASDEWIVGCVGRLEATKNQVLLARALARAVEIAPAARSRLRLAIVGAGDYREQIEHVLRDLKVHDLAWFAGARDDVAPLMRGFDSYALPSVAEGISNTLLEAMASGLPIVATAVGGNVELLDDGAAGRLVPSNDVDAMAHALLDDFADPAAARRRGAAARLAVEQRFSLERMVAAYGGLYRRLITGAIARGAAATAHRAIV
jgi:sugar transferase (PEP-CTERM/EpsH1 system associated)